MKSSAHITVEEFAQMLKDLRERTLHIDSYKGKNNRSYAMKRPPKTASKAWVGGKKVRRK